VQISINQMVSEAMAENGLDIPGQEDGEFWTAFMADQIIRQREEKGEFVEWPVYDEDQEESLAAQYPHEVWSNASAQWRSMNGAERTEFCAAGKQMIINDNAEGIDEFRGIMGIIGILVSNLHPMALIIMGIAVCTAFKVARNSAPKMPGADLETDTTSSMPQAATGLPGMPAGAGVGPGISGRSDAAKPLATGSVPSAVQSPPAESTYLPPWLRDK
jgi:hypothetical protein